MCKIIHEQAAEQTLWLDFDFFKRAPCHSEGGFRWFVGLLMKQADKLILVCVVCFPQGFGGFFCFSKVNVVKDWSASFVLFTENKPADMRQRQLLRDLPGKLVAYKFNVKLKAKMT